ncbi:MAG: hypothetical protein JKY09_06870 [Crocinitomicaceae bacterium]|nr:hypothetical protein [Crocinitomicaceae bacterium]
MKAITIIILVFSSLGIQAQHNASDKLKYKDLKIFNYLKEYQYRAIYIDSNGDTLSDEKIIVQPTAEVSPRHHSQTLLKYFYNYSDEDSVRLSAKPINETAFTKEHNTIKWRKRILEGAIENEHELWIHPFRANQYSLTEIAPFPEVHIHLEDNHTWKAHTFITKSWGTFKGKVKSNYVMNKAGKRIYKFASLDDCWKLKAEGKHSKLGTNILTYYYHAAYGFLEMNYEFYNKQKMFFVLEKVKTIKNE